MTLPEFYQEKDGVNSYVFVETLSQELRNDDVVVTDMGTSLSCTMQTFKVGQISFKTIFFACKNFAKRTTELVYPLI